ncbi:hypothetical protein ACFQ07_04660, partial [Actinomadura adrarensis]
ATTFRRMATAAVARPALVNGAAGLVSTIDGELFSIISFIVANGRIVEMDILSDPERLAAFDLSGLPDLSDESSGTA